MITKNITISVLSELKLESLLVRQLQKSVLLKYIEKSKYQT